MQTLLIMKLDRVACLVTKLGEMKDLCKGTIDWTEQQAKNRQAFIENAPPDADMDALININSDIISYDERICDITGSNLDCLEEIERLVTQKIPSIDDVYNDIKASFPISEYTKTEEEKQVLSPS
jgi:PAS domain-containing protein